MLLIVVVEECRGGDVIVRNCSPRVDLLNSIADFQVRRRVIARDVLDGGRRGQDLECWLIQPVSKLHRNLQLVELDTVGGRGGCQGVTGYNGVADGRLVGIRRVRGECWPANYGSPCLSFCHC